MAPVHRRAFLAAALAAATAACASQARRAIRAPVPGSGPGPATTTRPGGLAAGAPASRPPAGGLPKGPAAAVAHGPRDRRQVALTFHGSGDPALVEQLLAEAAGLRLPISVFVVGRWLETHPGMAARILAGGHELDNHTYTHPVLGRADRPAVAAEIRRCQAVLRALTGSGGRYFRPSGMTAPTPMVLAEAGAAGYPVVVSFDVDPRDYADPGADAVAARVAAGLRPGSVVSLHTGHAGTVAALGRIAAAIRGRGLEPVLLHRLLAGARSVP